MKFCVFKRHLLGLFFLKFVFSSPLHQQKQQEIERVDKWLKMLKKWGKYRNSDKVRRKRVYVWKGGCDESGFQKVDRKTRDLWNIA